MTRTTVQSHDVCNGTITARIISITISSNVIGAQTAVFCIIGRPILLITRMITDRIGLHSVLLPLYINRNYNKIQE